MAELKRYDLRDTYLGGSMTVSEDGEYVRWDDVKHLLVTNPFVRVTEDRRCLVISRCDWSYPHATDAAGPRDERRRALVGGRDGDIVLHFAEGAWLDAADAAAILADAFGVRACVSSEPCAHPLACSGHDKCVRAAETTCPKDECAQPWACPGETCARGVRGGDGKGPAPSHVDGGKQ
jgi:hypothetical protein